MSGRRIGFYSLRYHARMLCKFLYKYTPVIKALYPNSTTLHTALDAANLACSALVEAIDETAPVGV